jgi:hypothetical protein
MLGAAETNMACWLLQPLPAPQMRLLMTSVRKAIYSILG